MVKNRVRTAIKRWTVKYKPDGLWKLGNAIGVSHATMRRIYRGDDLMVSVATRLADTVGVTLDDIAKSNGKEGKKK